MSSYLTSTTAVANGSSKKISNSFMESFAFRDSRELHHAIVADRATASGDVFTGTSRDSAYESGDDAIVSSAGAAAIGSSENASDQSAEKKCSRCSEEMTAAAAAAASTNFGSSLLRVSTRPSGAAAPTGGPINTVVPSDDCPSPWRHEHCHKNSNIMRRSLAIRAEVAGRSAELQTLRGKAKALVDMVSGAIAGAAGSCAKFLCPPKEASVSVRDLEIRVIRNTRRCMQASDYAVWESGPSRVEWIRQQAAAENMTPEAWARQEGLRYI